MSVLLTTANAILILLQYLQSVHYIRCRDALEKGAKSIQIDFSTPHTFSFRTLQWRPVH